MTDLQPSEWAESRSTVLRRRLVTIPRHVILFVLLTLLLPLIVMAALLVDFVRWIATRRPAMALRLSLFAWVFLAVDLIGLARFGLDWLTSGFGRNKERLVERAWAVQAWWGRTLFNATRRLFSLRFQIDGLESVTGGPILAMFRHASIIDNLLPAVLLSDRLGYRLRWIIKRELLSEPALDVGGNRLPNYFVDRESSNPRNELRRIQALAVDLAPNEGVLIFPEGTRFSAARRQRALEKLRTTAHAVYERASRLRNVMPPRPGGVTALLDAGMRVVVCAHEGLGGFAKISDIWSGSLVGRTITVKLWTIEPDAIPTGRGPRTDWLYEIWRKMDDWIEEVRASRIVEVDVA